jgi:choline dehydrogenase
VRSRVTRLLLEGSKVTGIEVIRDRKRYHIKARKEVILSAGTVNSPQILMLSGIGPRSHLQVSLQKVSSRLRDQWEWL